MQQSIDITIIINIIQDNIPPVSIASMMYNTIFICQDKKSIFKITN